jgi:phage tail protein X
MTWGGYPANGPVWWTYTSNGNLANGYLYFNMKFADIAIGFGSTARVFGFWVNNTAGVDGATYYLNPGYGQADYGSYTGYFTVDHVGGVDGEVALSATAYAIDDAPQGLDDPFDMIHYYLETAPETPGIEVIENVSSFAFPYPLTTIKTFDGTPVDIACWKTFGMVTGATSNWLAVLENNGTSWQVALFDQTGALIIRQASAISGTPLHINCDNTNTTIHVWANDAGTVKYYILGLS